MGHNSVVSGYSKSIGILRVNGLSTGPPEIGESQSRLRILRRTPPLGIRANFSLLTSLSPFFFFFLKFQ